MQKPDAILVMDFGGQYAHLIGRRIRECQVYSELVPHDIKAKDVQSIERRLKVKGIILSGGPLSVYERNAPQFDAKILDLIIPVLGLCYGHQLIAQMFSGDVKPSQKREFGVTYVQIDQPVGVLNSLSRKEKVWMSHSDTVFSVPEEFKVLAHTENSPVAAFQHREKPIIGLQWHPEVIHTVNGMKMLRNFIFGICGCSSNWRMEDVTGKAIQATRRIVGENKAIIALSGGIDSSVATVIAAKALGKRLTAVFVDHGFMREGEPEFVESTFRKFDVNFISFDARRRFFQRLRGIEDPEEKRRIIGEEFIRVFEEVAKEVGAEFLIQGTIYPDRIESGIRKFSDKIKTHHNVGGLPIHIKFRQIVEPLKDLYKDEVRQMAEKLGLPQNIVLRPPFPGPGLAVRVIGEVTQDKIEIVRKADKIVTSEIEKSAWKNRLWQYFAVLTNTKSTGVKGDSRAYSYTVAVRVVESKEAMTASFARIPYDLLERISTRITNELPSVARVVYDITHKPPATIEWE